MRSPFLRFLVHFLLFSVCLSLLFSLSLCIYLASCMCIWMNGWMGVCIPAQTFCLSISFLFTSVSFLFFIDFLFPLFFLFVFISYPCHPYNYSYFYPAIPTIGFNSRIFFFFLLFLLVLFLFLSLLSIDWNRLLTKYKSSYLDLDLTATLLPPKELFVEV